MSDPHLDLSILHKLRNRGGNQIAQCPVCAAGGGDSKSEHLFITQDGKFGCVLHPGADGREHRKEIFAVIGVKPEKTQQNGAGRNRMKLERTHAYQDAEGNHVFDVVVYRLPNGDKDVRQRKADGTWSLQGVERVPYRLPQLLASDGPVWVVEGEKDVEKLEEGGLVATCNPGGAGKWRDEYSVHLVDRDAIVAPDNDQPGEDHAEAEANSNCKVAKSVRIVRWDRVWPTMPVGADISDALENGITIEEIEAAAEPWQPKEDPFICRDVFSLSADCDSGQVLLGDEWLRRGDVNSLVSMAGSGKSVAVDGGAILWAAGLPYLGIKPNGPLRIVLFVAEDDRETIGQQREGILANAGKLFGREITEAEREQIRGNLLIDFSREHVGEDFVAMRLEPVAKEHKADLVIVNPLLGYAGGNLVESGSRLLRSDLLPALQRLNAGAFAVLHTNKLGKDGMADLSQLYAATGGAEMANIPRGIIILNPTEDESVYRLRAEKRLTVGWEDEGGSFVREHYIGRTDSPKRPAWLSLPYHGTREALSEQKEQGRPKRCAGIHVRQEFDHDPNNVISKPKLIERLAESRGVTPKTARETVAGLIDTGELRIVREEARECGGHGIKFLALARGREDVNRQSNGSPPL